MRLPAIAVATVALAAPAVAYMPPEAYIALRAQATQHIQLTVDKVGEPPAPGYGDCPVGGHVARIFRDVDGSLSEGEALTALVPCKLPKVDDMPVGGTAWAGIDELRQAAVIEIYLLPAENGLYRIADEGDGLLILPAPTDEPQVVDEAQP